MDRTGEMATIELPARRVPMATLTANRTVAEKQNTPQTVEGPKQFMTAFGNLTVEEIMAWEKMLGKRLAKW